MGGAAGGLGPAVIKTKDVKFGASPLDVGDRMPVEEIGAAKGGSERISARATKADPSPRLAGRIADTLVQEMVESRQPEGAVVGTEAQLMKRFGVGRATLREAIRELERHGAAAMTRGGGLVVGKPVRTTAIRALTSYIAFAHLPLGELLEARILMGAQLAGLAADHANDESLLALRLAARQDFGDEGLLESRLHELVGRAAANPILSLMMEAIDPFLAAAPVPLRLPGDESRTLTEAIIGRNRCEAEIVARRLLAARYEPLRDKWDQPIRSMSGPGMKSGEQTASNIAADIAAGLTPGDRIGAEAELCLRYGVSRASLREAFRLLECHALLVGRRGRHGGFFVGAADPGYTVDVVKTFLRHLRLSPNQLSDARWALQPETAAMAARRAGDRNAMAPLEEILRVNYQSSDFDYEHDREFHILLAKASGNRVLGLFVSVLMAIYYRRADELVSHELRIRVHKTNLAILAAVGSQDPAFARRRMIQHLELALAEMQAGSIHF